MISKKNAKKLEKAFSLALNDDPESIERARKIRTNIDYEDLMRQKKERKKKTFKQFKEELSLSQAFRRAGKPSVPSERPTSATTLDSLRRRNTSDMPKPIGSRAGVPTTPLNQATYKGRVEAGRNTPNERKERVADDPNYQGPIRGVGSGTRDRMPGTTPSSSSTLPPRGQKFSAKPLGTNLAKPISKPKTTGPIKPQGTGGWV
jgi:hypothetical protein